MNKGKVIDIQKKYAVVMNDQMAYEKIEKKKGLTVGKEIYYFEEDCYEETKHPVKKYFLVAAVLFMMLFMQPLLVAEEAYGYISVDINPSLELEVNRDLEVLAIEAINEDAKTLIKDDWIGKPAKEVINLIIEETRSKGILNEQRDFVLVSYYFNDDDPSSDQVFVQSLDELFNEKAHDYEVAVIKSDADTYSEAKKVKESLGRQVVNKKLNTKVEDLLSAKESIEKDEDFKVYKKSSDSESKNDDDSDKSLGVLGRKAAETIAFESIGEHGTIIDFDFERDEDEAEYQFEIASEDKIYKIKINGFTGEVTTYEEEKNDAIDETSNKEKNRNGFIGRKAAETIAFEAIGKQGDIINFNFERDDGEAEYQFDIALDNQIYKIKIDGFSGKVITNKIEENDDSDDTSNTGKNRNGVIGRKAAEIIAFEFIGQAGNVIEFDFSRDDDEAEYEFEVVSNSNIYKIKIDGFTGKIIEHELDKEKDSDDIDENPKKEEKRRNILERKEAETIAFKVIGNAGEIIDYVFDQDDDDAEYVFEIASNGKVHKLKINGFTGEVIENDTVDDENDGDSSQDENRKEILERKEAETIAFKAIGNAGEIIDYTFDQDDDDAEYAFEIAFNGKVHKLKINGFTGDVIAYEVDEIDEVDDTEDDDDYTDDESTEDENRKGYMGRKSAEIIAFKTIGAEGEIIDYAFDQDDDDAEYVFEIVSENKVHMIKINGFTGEVMAYEVDDENNDDD